MRLGSLFTALFSVASLILPCVSSSTGWDKIAGYDEVKKELTHLAHFMTHPHLYEQWNVRLPRGCLLHGPPGTGKTLLARSMAEHISSELGYNITFLVTAGSDFQEKYVGVGAARIRELFRFARENAPTILFIDEMDSIGRRRSSSDDGSGGRDRDSTLNALLVEMDGFVSRKYPVFVMGSTNRLEVLDDALLRPGRLDKLIHIPLPSYDTRLEILWLHARQKPIVDDMDMERIARKTQGFSGAELENVLNEATLFAIRENRLPVTLEQLEKMVTRISLGTSSGEDENQQEKILMNTPYNTLYAIAVHELGHFYTSLACPTHPPAIEVSITRPTPHTLGYTRFEPRDEKEGKVLYSVQELLEEVRVLLGGRAAEYLVFGDLNMSTGASGDWRRVSQILHSMMTTYGFSFPAGGNITIQVSSLYSESSRTSLDEMMTQVLDTQWQWVLSALAPMTQILESKAHQLVKDRTWGEDELPR